MLLTLDWLWERPQTLIQRRHVSSVRVGLANSTKRTPSRNSSFSSSSSSSNNIQDQCLIITDIYGVREKGVWPKKSKKIMPKLGEPELHVPHEQCLTVCFLFLFFYFVLTPPSSRSHCTLSTLRYTRRHLPSDVPWISQAAPQVSNAQEWQRWRRVM